MAFIMRSVRESGRVTKDILEEPSLKQGVTKDASLAEFFQLPAGASGVCYETPEALARRRSRRGLKNR